MHVNYEINKKISIDEFVDLFQRSGLAGRRPVDDVVCIAGMLEHTNLMITAWNEDKLIGVARSVTDFHFACYLSDLAVDKNWQNKGIGKELQRLTQKALGSRCKLILLAAPTADSYYEHIGFARNTRCWVLEPDERIK